MTEDSLRAFLSHGLSLRKPARRLADRPKTHESTTLDVDDLLFLTALTTSTYSLAGGKAGYIWQSQSETQCLTIPQYRPQPPCSRAHGWPGLVMIYSTTDICFN